MNHSRTITIFLRLFSLSLQLSLPLSSYLSFFIFLPVSISLFISLANYPTLSLYLSISLSFNNAQRKRIKRKRNKFIIRCRQANTHCSGIIILLSKSFRQKLNYCRAYCKKILLPSIAEKILHPSIAEK